MRKRLIAYLAILLIAALACFLIIRTNSSSDRGDDPNRPTSNCTGDICLGTGSK